MYESPTRTTSQQYASVKVGSVVVVVVLLLLLLLLRMLLLLVVVVVLLLLLLLLFLLMLFLYGCLYKLLHSVYLDTLELILLSSCMINRMGRCKSFTTLLIIKSKEKSYSFGFFIKRITNDKSVDLL